ncbi:MAG: DUF2058 family protein [Lysobacteraceae bacterium]|uniref:DUF2058 domain-containing protein n=1 Tax=Denitratimonas sp. CY0512 TaxID=3131940 RepID=UPI0030ADFBEF
MSDSLKDQLMKLGFKAPPREERRPADEPRRGGEKRSQGRRPGRPAAKPGAGDNHRKPQRNAGSKREDIDLAKAYAIRAQKEKDERIAAEKQRQEEARQRREARAKLTELLNRVRLNLDNAEIARHFEYGGKIRRVHVDDAQLKALNAGELAVVQLGGRYHLVSLADAQAAEAIMPGSLALRVDPNAPPENDEYADPKYQVPDDLVW